MLKAAIYNEGHDSYILIVRVKEINNSNNSNNNNNNNNDNNNNNINNNIIIIIIMMTTITITIVVWITFKNYWRLIKLMDGNITYLNELIFTRISFNEN